MWVAFVPGIFSKTLKSEVSRSFFVASPLRCDPNRGQRRQQEAAASPRCDPMRIVRTSGMASTMVFVDEWAESCWCWAENNCEQYVFEFGWEIWILQGLLDRRFGVLGGVLVFASALRSKTMNGAGGPMCGDHGLSSSKCTSRSFADSSALRGQVVDGKAWNCRQSSDFDDLFVPCMSPSQRVHLVDSVVSLSSSQDTHNMHGDMNSCGSVHGGVMHDNSSGMHVNSYGALGHKNSCHVHAAEVRGGTKALSMSTRLGFWCPAVEELASPQQAPGSLHGEVWASILQNQGPKIFREVEIIPGCAATVACPSCPDHSPEPPGPGRIIRNMLGWSLMEKNEVGSGVWLFRGALQGKNLFSSLDVIGDWERKGTYQTAWALPWDSSCACSYSYGQGRTAIGPHTGRRCWPLLEGVWRAIAPLMKPWCAEGEVPTAANLNLYRGGNSCVGWHRDDELLFGEFGEAKLIVSVSLGGSAVFRWKRRSCPNDEGHLCCLGHGDILVMDGRCQDKFLHRTDPCREQERINITFLWIKQHVSSCPLFRTGVACCLPTCAQGFICSCYGEFLVWHFLGFFGFSSVSCVLGDS